MIAPLGPVYQAGTLSGNPLAMAAGIATLRKLKRERATIYQDLEKSASTLLKGVTQTAVGSGIPISGQRVGSMFTWFFRTGEIQNYDDAAKSDTAQFARFHRAMLDRGVYLPPSQFEAAFLSAAHTAEDIERTIDAARKTFAAFDRTAVTSL